MEAERQAAVSPTAAAFFAGKAVEVAVKWAFRTDPGLKLPYQDNIAALLHEPSFRRAAGEAVFAKARYINTLRNRAVHEETTIRPGDAAGAVKELFHVCFWLARTYARKARPADGLAFDASRAVAPRRDAEESLRASEGAAGRARREERRAGEAARRQAEPRRRAEEAARRGRRRAKAAEAAPDAPRLQRGRDPRPLHRPCCCARPAGRSTGRKTSSSASRACPTTKASASSTTCCGAPTASRLGWSRPSAPARTRAQGQQQAKLYADRLEARYGQRPVIFYSNGYEHWIWDDPKYPPRQIGGFYKRDELELLIQRRTEPQEAGRDAINTKIVRAALSAPRHPRDRQAASRTMASARRCWSWRPAPARRAR